MRRARPTGGQSSPRGISITTGRFAASAGAAAVLDNYLSRYSSNKNDACHREMISTDGHENAMSNDAAIVRATFQAHPMCQMRLVGKSESNRKLRSGFMHCIGHGVAGKHGVHALRSEWLRLPEVWPVLGFSRTSPSSSKSISTRTVRLAPTMGKDRSSAFPGPASAASNSRRAMMYRASENSASNAVDPSRVPASMVGAREADTCGRSSIFMQNQSATIATIREFPAGELFPHQAGGTPA